MKLLTMTSGEVEAYFQSCDERNSGIVLPVGSLEQHGPIGLLGTDALCAQRIAERAGELVDAIVAPALVYTPAQFNMAFAGTVSVSSRVFAQYFEEIIRAFAQQGFQRIYVLNAHGANLAPMQVAMHDVYADPPVEAPLIRIKSWWDFDSVNRLRDQFYGAREGLHATPSEVAITQYTDREVTPNHDIAYTQVSARFIKDHAGDKHDPGPLHRQQFPDGQVGSDSSLATPQQGEQLLQAAAEAVADDYQEFIGRP